MNRIDPSGHVWLERGNKGPNVKVLQIILATLGYMSPTDIVSNFGPKTQQAVNKYKKNRG